MFIAENRLFLYFCMVLFFAHWHSVKNSCIYWKRVNGKTAYNSKQVWDLIKFFVRWLFQELNTMETPSTIPYQ